MVTGYLCESVGTLNLSHSFFSGNDFNGLSVGCNLKAAYRYIPKEFSPNQSALAFMVDIGFQTSFNLFKSNDTRSNCLSIGAAIKNFGISLLGQEQLPIMATAGVAYSPVQPLTIAFDFNYPISLDPINIPSERWYIAVGVNVIVVSFLSIQCGVLCKADNPQVSLGTALDFGRVGFVINYNIDLSGQANMVDKISVQARFNLAN